MPYSFRSCSIFTALRVPFGQLIDLVYQFKKKVHCYRCFNGYNWDVLSTDKESVITKDIGKVEKGTSKLHQFLKIGCQKSFGKLNHIVEKMVLLMTLCEVVCQI